MSAGQLARSRLVGDRPTLTLRPPWAKWRFFAAGAATTRLARDALAPQGTQGLLWRPGRRRRHARKKGVDCVDRAISPLLRSDFAQSTAGSNAERRPHGQFRP
jgi:hypothetical protein